MMVALSVLLSLIAHKQHYFLLVKQTRELSAH